LVDQKDLESRFKLIEEENKTLKAKIICLEQSIVEKENDTKTEQKHWTEKMDQMELSLLNNSESAKKSLDQLTATIQSEKEHVIQLNDKISAINMTNQKLQTELEKLRHEKSEMEVFQETIAKYEREMSSLKEEVASESMKENLKALSEEVKVKDSEIKIYLESNKVLEENIKLKENEIEGNNVTIEEMRLQILDQRNEKDSIQKTREEVETEFENKLIERDLKIDCIGNEIKDLDSRLQLGFNDF